jgi:2-C-methyl-D-erythritol 4-phosphate cytidylyltransferase
MSNYVIITAGGIGLRMNSNIPKQFIKVMDKPILMHTIDKFHSFDKSLQFIITLPANYISNWDSLCKEYAYTVKHMTVVGGNTRYKSIKNALNKIENADLVAVHDGVRPLVSKDTIKKCFESAKQYGNAISSSEIFFSLRQICKTGSKSVQRKDYMEIQTPQVFQFDILKEAYKLEYSDDFTDDATVVEKAGYEIHLIQGNRENIKITTEIDLKIAEVLWDTVF